MNFKNHARSTKDNNLERNIQSVTNSNELSPGNVLARMFWAMFSDNDTLTNKGARWNALMELWVNDQVKSGTTVASARSTARGNATKEFMRRRFSWNVFIKGMRFLRKRRVRFTIDAWDEQGNLTTTTAEMDLRMLSSEEDENKSASVQNWLTVLDEHAVPVPSLSATPTATKPPVVENPTMASELLAKIKKDKNG